MVAERLGLPFESARVRVDPPSEAEARRVRYLALEEMAERVGVGKIATGHTLDDQAETVLMRLGRGGYPMGIPPRRGRIVRPILGLRRSHTERICREAGVGFIEDPSNADERFTRNRLRHRVLCHLDERSVVRLARLGEAARLRAVALAEQVERLSCFIAHFGVGVAELDRGALLQLAPDVSRAVIRRTLERLGLAPTSRLVRDISVKVVPTTGARLDLPLGGCVWSERERIVVGEWPATPPIPPAPVAVPGRTALSDWGLQIIAEEVPAPPRAKRLATPDLETFMDRSRLGEGLVVRQRLQGDSFHPLGAAGTRKLQDFLVDEKIPRWARDRVPILVCGNRILWVIGYRIDDACKLTTASSKAIRIRVVPSAVATASLPGKHKIRAMRGQR